MCVRVCARKNVSKGCPGFGRSTCNPLKAYVGSLAFSGLCQVPPALEIPPTLTDVVTEDQERLLQQPLFAAILLHSAVGITAAYPAKQSCQAMFASLVDGMWCHAGRGPTYGTSGVASERASAEAERASCEEALQQLALNMCCRGEHILPLCSVDEWILGLLSISFFGVS